MIRPKLPNFDVENQVLTLDDLHEIVEAIRQMWPIAGAHAEIVPHFVAGGVYYTGAGGGSGSGLIDIKITADISAATWAAGSAGCTAEGTGTCRLVNPDGSIDGTDRTIYSRWPGTGPVTATRFGQAKRQYGKLYLVSASCGTIPA